MNSKKFTIFLAATACVLGVVLLFDLLGGSDKLKDNTKDKVIAKTQEAFETTANIKYKDIEAAVVIVNTPPKTCTVEFLSPKGIKGMSFFFEGNDISIDYNGMSFTFNPNTLPGGAVAKMVVSTINAATSKEGVTVALEKNVLEIAGESEAGAFILKLDRDNGNFIRLSIPENEFEMEFVNFNFLE